MPSLNNTSLIPLIVNINNNFLDIPYGTELITCSQELGSVNCVIYNPLQILICVTCGISVKPSRLRYHRRSKPHFDTTINENLVESFIKNYNLYLFDYFPPEIAPKTAVPGISCVEGYVCSSDGCFKATTSIQTIKRHMSNVHNAPPRSHSKSLVQVIFESNSQRYGVTVASSMQPPPSSSYASPSPLQILLRQYSNKAIPLLEAPKDPAVLNPFLEKYRWLDILKGLSAVKIRNWVSLPGGSIVAELEVSVKKYYARICQEMRLLDKHITTLRWIEATKK